MKHSYRPDCACDHCMKERERRTAQAAHDPRRAYQERQKRARRTPRTTSRKPAYGSAEWAETRGDDIPSYDVPGDDFDA